jgi:NADPH2:quinone reductase
MKAIVVSTFGEPDVLKMHSVPDPVPNPNQVLIKVITTGVNFADIMSRQGRFGKSLPFTPGTDVAGIIESVGKDVKNLSVGQRVMALSSSGAYAEKAVADAVVTFPIPDSMDFDVAGALLVVGTTAYNIVNNVAKVKKGESVLIHAAAGGVGSTAVQLVKLQGAAKIIATVGSNEKVQLVQGLGADEVINYREEDFAQKVNQLTNGTGVDVILDSVSGKVFEQGLTCLAKRGRIVIYSHASGEPGVIKTNQLNPFSKSVCGYSMSNNTPKELKKTVNSLIELFKENTLKILIGKEFDFSVVHEAHQWVESRRSIGKTLIRIVKD